MSGVVIHISATDGTGGAARAARRLHEGLERQGWESWILAGRLEIGGERVRTLNGATRRVKSRPAGLAEQLWLEGGGLLGERRVPVPSSRRLPRTELFDRADVVHVHNMHGFYLDYTVLPAWARSRPIVVTLHDMWAFTGHCAYSFGCERWRTGCGSCPMWTAAGRRLDEVPRTPWDCSAGEWRRKRDTWRRVVPTVVAPSRWLAQLADQSILTARRQARVKHLPYGIDSELWRPLPQDLARRALGIGDGPPVVLFAAASPDQERKGLAHLTRAWRVVREAWPGALLLMLGAASAPLPELPDVRRLGRVDSAALQRLAYSAADAFVLPSLADNQPLTMLESMACGTPVVAFAAGGIPETVRDGQTGLLARAGDPAELAAAVMRVLEDAELRERLGSAARRHIEREHGLSDRAADHQRLYQEVLAGRAVAAPALRSAT